MKKNINMIKNYKFYTVCLFLLLALSLHVDAQEEYTKRINKSYKINNSTTIDIFNKYGKVLIITWDKDSVMFDIDLKIRTTKESKLKKLKNSINFDFTGTEYYVVAQTKIGNKSGGFFTDIKDLAESFVSADNKVTIDYTVMVPKYANIKLENKFGDIFIDDLEGNLNLSLSNGRIKANSLNGNTVLNISSGDANINFIKDGKLAVSYSDLQIKNAKKIIFESRSSEINIEQIDFLKINSRRDKYYLSSVNELYGEANWSYLSIDDLKEELNVDSRFGDINVNLINRTFEFISIISENTDIDLLFERGSSYIIDIIHHEDAIVSYPTRIAQIEEEIIDKSEEQMLTSGKIGTGTASSKVKISAPKKCSINIIHK